MGIVVCVCMLGTSSPTLMSVMKADMDNDINRAIITLNVSWKYRLGIFIGASIRDAGDHSQQFLH